MGPGLFPDAFFAQVDAVVGQNHAGRHSFLEKFAPKAGSFKVANPCCCLRCLTA
jgi:hypothetical protein